MKPADTDDKLLALRRDLAMRRERILRSAPENALDAILAHPQPAALVHAFPEEDLHILIHEIGPDDALPLLALASHRQLEYLLDQELWQRDRLDGDAARQWLERLLRADDPSKRLVRWLAEEKTDLVDLVLGRSIEVRLREHDQDPSDFGPGFFTYDSVFYIRILAPGPLSDAEAAALPETTAVKTVKSLLDRLAETDYPRFQAIILEATHLLPAESEEEAYRLRNVRLAEKGFLPFEEAVGIYQPLNEQTFRQRALRQAPMVPEQPDHFPLVPSAALPEGNLLARALAVIDSAEQRQTLQEEFAALCNRIIVADRQTIHRRDDLAAVVAKASGYVSIGLEKQPAGDASAGQRLAVAVETLRRHHLEGLFRLGYDEAVRLKQAAEGWVQRSWFAGCGLPLTFWGEGWLGVIGGLLLKRPLFFDNYQTGVLYRDFAEGRDIEGTRRQLQQVQSVDRLIGRLALERGALPTGRFLTYQNLLLTLWARHCLGLPAEVRPLTVEAFRPFFKTLFAPGERPQRGRSRPIDPARKEAFLAWLADRAQEPAADIAAVIGSTLQDLFEALEENYGRVRPDRIDPRYVTHFLLAPSSPQPR